MNGYDFLPIAEKLAQSPAEAALRSAISRAYYAAYHCGCEVLDKKEFHGVRVPRTHGGVPKYFSNCGDAKIAEAGRMLADLYTHRHAADYDLRDNRYSQPMNTQLHLVAARFIIGQFQRCEKASVAATVAQGMMMYQSKINAAGGGTAKA